MKTMGIVAVSVLAIRPCRPSDRRDHADLTRDQVGGQCRQPVHRLAAQRYSIATLRPSV